MTHWVNDLFCWDMAGCSPSTFGVNDGRLNSPRMGKQWALQQNMKCILYWVTAFAVCRALFTYPIVETACTGDVQTICANERRDITWYRASKSKLETSSEWLINCWLQNKENIWCYHHILTLQVLMDECGKSVGLNISRNAIMSRHPRHYNHVN